MLLEEIKKHSCQAKKVKWKLENKDKAKIVETKTPPSKKNEE
jgi:hypothetical protein